MNEAKISQYITETFEGVDVVIDSGNSFFFYSPDKNVPSDHRFPFVTLVRLRYGLGVYDDCPLRLSAAKALGKALTMSGMKGNPIKEHL